MILAEAFVPDIVIEESDVVLATERTKPLYPTEGPGDGRTWSEFFRQAKSQKSQEVEEDEPMSVLEAGRVLDSPLTSLSSRSAAGILCKRLLGAGWQVEVSQSRAAVPTTTYKHDSDDGEHFRGDVKTEGYELTWTCVRAVKRAGGQFLALDASWTDRTGFQGATTHDPVLGREWRGTVTKPRKQRAWEKSEGLAAPMGFNQWLDIICPKPKKEEK
jgi:hypothetical protein